MKIVSRPASRWPAIPSGVVLFVVLWALVVFLTHLYTHYMGAKIDTCLFHRLTGYSCPTCGTTRGVMALARGAWQEAFAWNPMTMTGGAVLALGVIGRAITGRALVFQLVPLEKRILTVLGLLALGLNWAWLIYSHP